MDRKEVDLNNSKTGNDEFMRIKISPIGSTSKSLPDKISYYEP